MVESEETILITGTTGFVGSHICNAVLNEAPHLKVRLAVRSLDEKRISILKDGFGEDNFERVTCVKADLTDDESMKEAIRGC